MLRFGTRKVISLVETESLRYWVGFNLAKGVGPVRFRALLEKFGDAKSAWHASPPALRDARLDHRALDSLLRTRSGANLDAALRQIERAGAWVLTLEDAEYPPLLRTVLDSPPLLYVRGTLTERDHAALAVVGTRRATAYGKTITEEVVGPLARAGFTIVSGLAHGIDSVAHRTALNVGGRTIAALPCGIDKIYPPEHRQLADDIAANGALISELAPGEPAERMHFPPRNRIISGLCLGTLVVEAPERSGALSTADLALEQGREVFAVPGNALSPASMGTNMLLRAGATMVTSAEDVLTALGITLPPERRAAPGERKPTSKPPASKPIPQGANDVEAQILQLLAVEPQHIDILARRVELPIQQVSSTLTILELKGLVYQVGVMQYALA